MWLGIVVTRSQAPATATPKSSAATSQTLERGSRLSFPFDWSLRMGLFVVSSDWRGLPAVSRGTRAILCVPVLRSTQGVLANRFRL